MNQTLPPSRFAERLKTEGLDLNRVSPDWLQINLGRLCNQACHHCHLEAGPKRTEVMQQTTMVRLLEVLDHSPSIKKIDLTGGAPELNPDFRFLIKSLKSRGLQVISRCNLTILLEPGQQDTAQFYADQGVDLVCSLPCYSSKNVNHQRGLGVFEKSIAALRLLNQLGYGQGKLKLDLVYNPDGPSLPPDQKKLEEDYKNRLMADFGIVFDQLLTITNMPIKRFLDQLDKAGAAAQYVELLTQSFNPLAAAQVMCLKLISVDWQGRLFDCDFNQALDLPTKAGDLWLINHFGQTEGKIRFGEHCYGCTAGTGSSCGGALG